MYIAWYYVVIAVVLVLMFAALAFGAGRKKWSTHRLVSAAMCIAISFVLSMVKLFNMPQGGSVTPASMLPMVLFCLAAGPWQGLAAGFAYGLVQLLSSPYVIHPIQLLTDYPMAFGAMALSCLAMKIDEKSIWRVPVAVVLASLGRYVMAVISGIAFFSENAGPEGVLIYSLVYNGSYMWADCLFCLIVAFVPGMPRLVRMLKGESN